MSLNFNNEIVSVKPIREGVDLPSKCNSGYRCRRNYRLNKDVTLRFLSLDEGQSVFIESEDRVYFRLLIVLKGELSILKRRIRKNGGLIQLNPGEIQIKNNQEGLCGVVCMEFSKQSLQSFIGLNRFSSSVEYLFPEVKDTFEKCVEVEIGFIKLIREIVDFGRLGEDAERYLRKSLLSLIFFAFGGRYACYSERIIELKKKLSNHCHENLSISDLAVEFGLSESLLLKAFKTMYLVTPRQYLTNCKMLEANRLLKMNNATVNEVAFSLGYESVSSFSRAYFKRYGVRPGKMKKER